MLAPDGRLETGVFSCSHALSRKSPAVMLIRKPEPWQLLHHNLREIPAMNQIVPGPSTHAAPQCRRQCARRHRRRRQGRSGARRHHRARPHHEGPQDGRGRHRRRASRSANSARSSASPSSDIAPGRLGPRAQCRHGAISPATMPSARTPRTEDILPLEQQATFQGYRRANGKVGTRNYIGIMTSGELLGHGCRLHRRGGRSARACSTIIPTSTASWR